MAELKLGLHGPVRSFRPGHPTPSGRGRIEARSAGQCHGVLFPVIPRPLGVAELKLHIAPPPVGREQQVIPRPLGVAELKPSQGQEGLLLELRHPTPSGRGRIEAPTTAGPAPGAAARHPTPSGRGRIEALMRYFIPSLTTVVIPRPLGVAELKQRHLRLGGGGRAGHPTPSGRGRIEADPASATKEAPIRVIPRPLGVAELKPACHTGVLAVVRTGHPTPSGRGRIEAGIRTAYSEARRCVIPRPLGVAELKQSYQVEDISGIAVIPRPLGVAELKPGGRRGPVPPEQRRHPTPSGRGRIEAQPAALAQAPVM